MQRLINAIELVREAEIAQLARPLLDEHIRWLDVSMHNIERCQIATRHSDLMRSFGPIYFLLGVDAGLQGSALAVLHDDVAIVSCVVYVEQRHDVRVLGHF